MTDFAELLSRSLPGIYRLKDASGDLARFLQIIASPLAETEDSIGQLYDDLFGASARADFLPLIGDLIGAEIDPTLPASLQRAALEDTLASHRSKGLAQPLVRTVQALTSWRTIAVDYSQVVTRAPFVETLSPVVWRRRRAVGVDAGGANRFSFDASGKPIALFDDERGRAIARTEIAALAADLVGTDRGFAILESGGDLVGPRAPAPRPVVAANLTSFGDPRALDGAPLVLAAGAIAVDPELGRLLFAAPVPLAGNLTVDFHQLVPAALAPNTFDLRDSARMAQLGRSDDPAPYTIDLRSPERPTDRIGRTHFDNHGLFVTVGRIVQNRIPTRLHIGPPDGFAFDDLGGQALQLQDGIDGSPLTRAKLDGQEPGFADTPRGFAITVRGTSLLDPSFGAGARVIAARLADLASPRTAAGDPLVLEARDIAVDPQLGRFVVDLGAFGVAADDLRVDYLLAAAVRTTGATPSRIGPASSNTFAFAADGRLAPLRDALDGTLIASKLRLGAVVADFHGTPRGYRIFAGATELTQTLSPQLAALDPPITAPAGTIVVDLDRGRFALPAAAVPAGTTVTVDYSAADDASDARTFENLAQRLPRVVPAGIAPVIVDTRKPLVDPANLELASRTNNA